MDAIVNFVEKDVVAVKLACEKRRDGDNTDNATWDDMAANVKDAAIKGIELDLEVFKVSSTPAATNNFWSLKEMVSLLTVIELIASWGLYPQVIAIKNQKGKSTVDDCKKMWYEKARCPSKSLNLDADTLFWGLYANWRGRSKNVKPDEKLLQSINDCFSELVKSPYVAPFVQHRLVPDLLVAKIATGTTKAKIYEEMELSVAIRGLLCLAKTFGMLKKSYNFSGKVLPNTIGSHLSYCVQQENGVACIISEMLSNIPTGNVQAYMHVGSLLSTPPENIHKSEYYENILLQLRLILEKLHLQQKTVDDDKNIILQRSRMLRSVAITLGCLIKKCKNIKLVRSVLWDPLLTEIEDSKKIYCVNLVHNVLKIAPPTSGVLSSVRNFMFKVFSWYSIDMDVQGECKSLLLTYAAHETAKTLAYFLRTAVLDDDMEVALRSSHIPLTPKKLSSESDLTSRFFLDTDKKEEGEEDDDDDEDEESENPKLRFKIKSMIQLTTHFDSDKRSGTLVTMFVQSLQGISRLLTDEDYFDAVQKDMVWEKLARENCDRINQMNFFYTDMLLLRYLLPECNIALLKKQQPQSMESQEKVPTIPPPMQLGNAIVDILTAAVTVFGLWTYEEKMHDSTGEFHRGNKEPTTLLMVALEITPICVLMAAVLVSPDDQDTLWFTPELKRERRLLMQKLLKPITALTRGNRHITDSQSRISKNEDVKKVIEEVAEVAMSIRISLLTNQQLEDCHETMDNTCVQKILENEDAVEDASVIDPIGRSIAQARADLKDKEPPVRAMGIDKLRSLVLRKGENSGLPIAQSATLPELSENHVNNIMALLIDQIMDREPYVYLIAIRAIGAVADKYPSVAIPFVLHLFRDAEDSGSKITLKIRLGEVLIIVARRAGKMLPVFATELIRTYIHASSIRSKENDIHYRQSCLSNLAEICYLAPYSASENITDIVTLIEGLMTFESVSENVTTCCMYLLYKLLSGLESSKRENNWHVTLARELKTIHATLRCTYDKESTNSGVTLGHCEQALHLFDQLMKYYLLPKSITENKKELKVSILPH